MGYLATFTPILFDGWFRFLNLIIINMKHILIALSFLAVFGACSAQSSAAGTTKSTDTAAKKYRQFVRRNVKSDSTFLVRLPAALGEGYSWQLIDSSFSGYVAFEKEESKNQVKSQAGSASIQVFYFKALKPGTTTIRFIYGRPFQKPLPKDAPRRIIKVVIS
jgi:predicted secreted protein